MPAADDQNAWVVSISADGRLWFGADLVTRDGLVNKMISTPRNRNQNLYIKADARASYSDVEFVLKASHTVEFDAPILLTAQKESPQPGAIIPPKGLDVSLESGATVGPKPAEIDVVSTQNTTVVKVNNQQVPWESLQPTLEQLFGNRTENVVRLKSRRRGSLRANRACHRRLPLSIIQGHPRYPLCMKFSKGASARSMTARDGASREKSDRTFRDPSSFPVHCFSRAVYSERETSRAWTTPPSCHLPPSRS